MKKLMLLTLCAPVVLLLSFTFQRQIPEVKRISTHLYTVSPMATKRVAVQDKEEIKRIVAEHYGIKEFTRGSISIAANDPRNKMGGILDNSIYKDWVSTKLFFWKNIKTLPEEIVKANEIMTRYAAGR